MDYGHSKPVGNSRAIKVNPECSTTDHEYTNLLFFAQSHKRARPRENRTSDLRK